MILSKTIAIIKEIFERDLLVSILICRQDSILQGLLDSRHVYISFSNEFMEKSFALFLAAREKSGSEAIQMLFDDPFWNYFVPSSEFPNARKLFEEIVKENTQVFFIDPNLNQPLDPSAVKRLSEISIPTLIISAERDHSDNIAVVELLGGGIEGAKTIEISGVGHMANMEKPEEFNKIVYNFLSNL